MHGKKAQLDNIIIDKKIFDKIYDQYYKGLVGFAYSFLNDQISSEDIVQDLFCYLWEKKLSFTNSVSLKSYLYKSIQNNCLNLLRHQKIANKYSEEQLKILETEEDLQKRILTEEVYRLLYQGIEGLSEKRKNVIILGMKGYRNEEIAEMLEISKNTVKTHKKVGYQMLREKMKDHELLLFILLGL